MSIINLLRRFARRLFSISNADCPDNLIYGDVDGQLRVMSNEEFAEYLRLHTRHRSNV